MFTYEFDLVNQYFLFVRQDLPPSPTKLVVTQLLFSRVMQILVAGP